MGQTMVLLVLRTSTLFTVFFLPVLKALNVRHVVDDTPRYWELIDSIMEHVSSSFERACTYVLAAFEVRLIRYTVLWKRQNMSLTNRHPLHRTCQSLPNDVELPSR
jgi:hypothetical protein